MGFSAAKVAILTVFKKWTGDKKPATTQQKWRQPSDEEKYF